MLKGILGVSILEWMRKKKRGEWISLGLRHERVVLNDGQGTVIYVWYSSQKSSHTRTNNSNNSKRPWVVLIHDFGADGLSGWETDQVKGLVKHNWQVVVVDLLFLGGSKSTTEGKGRSEVFQAECIKKALDQLRIDSVVIAGHGYGGFVAFWMATLYGSNVVGLALISSAICLKPHDNDKVRADFGSTDMKDMLMPKNEDDVLKILKFTFYSLPLPLRLTPSLVCSDLLQMFRDNTERKLEMLECTLIGSENCPPLPTLNHLQIANTVVIWGENDRVFPLEHACRFNKHVGGKAEIVVINECGHLPQMEKPSQLTNALLTFLSKKWPSY